MQLTGELVLRAQLSYFAASKFLGVLEVSGQVCMLEQLDDSAPHRGPAVAWGALVAALGRVRLACVSARVVSL